MVRIYQCSSLVQATILLVAFVVGIYHGAFLPIAHGFLNRQPKAGFTSNSRWMPSTDALLPSFGCPGKRRNRRHPFMYRNAQIDKNQDKNEENEHENNAEASYNEGEELARKFYEFQNNEQAREQQQQQQGEPLSDNRNNEDPEMKISNKTAGAQRPVAKLDDSLIKFTGRQQSLFSEPAPTTRTRTGGGGTPLSRERQGEFNLASTFERTLPIQAGVLAFCLAFVLYVGFTGGITSGGVNGMDDVVDDNSFYWNDNNHIFRPLGTDEEGIHGDGIDQFREKKSSEESVWL
ncbi:hypothetical protein ACA910_012321 [Epithemia clementina (nom. ined.)]